MIERLSSSLGTREQKHNIDLAKELSLNNDIDGIDEIADNLFNKDKSIAGDCIKVMYEIGNINPKLITKHIDIFLKLITSRNNRMVWGSMYAVSQCAPFGIDKKNTCFSSIVKAYENGSVITIDCCMTVFAEIIKADVSNSKKAYNIIIEHLKTCRAKEVPQHSERTFLCINDSNAKVYKGVLSYRMKHLTPSQQKRVHTILNKIENKQFV